MKIPKHIKRFGNWLVTEIGIVHFGIPPYFISAQRTGDCGWCWHISKKSWADVINLEKALLFARKHFYIPEPKYGDWSERYWVNPGIDKRVLENESCRQISLQR